MKYSALKKMKKSTKIGLAGSLAYAGLSFITPVLANNNVKSFDIKAIENVEQAGQAYEDQMKSYAEDKKITYEEITDLNDILNKYWVLLDIQKQNLKSKVWELESPYNLSSKEEEEIRNQIYRLRMSHNPNSEQKQKIRDEIYELKRKPSSFTSVQIKIAKESIAKLESKKVYVSPEFEKIKEDLDEKVLRYYPSLIEKDKGVMYSASDSVEEILNPVVKELILKTDEFLKEYYNDAELEFLAMKEAYSIKDLLVYYEILHEERKAVCFNLEEILPEKQKLEAELKALEAKEKKYLEEGKLKINGLGKVLQYLEQKRLQHIAENKLKIKDLQKKLGVLEDKKLKWIADNNKQAYELNQIISKISKKIWKVEEESAHFEKYFERKSCAEEFIKEYGDLNKYLSLSLYSVEDGFLEGLDIGSRKKNFNYYNEQAESRLEDYFKDKGFDVEVASLKNPVKPMVPWPWGVNVLFGIFFPMIRNALSAKFIRRDFDAFDCIEGGIEGMLCPILLDGIHPLVFPLRLFAMPFLFEPIRAVTGWRDEK